MGKFRLSFFQISQVPAFIVKGRKLYTSVSVVTYNCLSCTGSQLTMAVLRKLTDVRYFFPGLSWSNSVTSDEDTKGRNKLFSDILVQIIGYQPVGMKS